MKSSILFSVAIVLACFMFSFTTSNTDTGFPTYLHIKCKKTNDSDNVDEVYAKIWVNNETNPSIVTEVRQIATNSSTYPDKIVIKVSDHPIGATKIEVWDKDQEASDSTDDLVWKCEQYCHEYRDEEGFRQGPNTYDELKGTTYTVWWIN